MRCVDPRKITNEAFCLAADDLIDLYGVVAFLRALEISAAIFKKFDSLVSSRSPCRHAGGEPRLMAPPQDLYEESIHRCTIERPSGYTEAGILCLPRRYDS